MFEYIFEFVFMHFIWLVIVFIWVMKLRDLTEGTKWEKPLRNTVGIAAFAFDWWVNMIPASILFFGLPGKKGREVVTGRIKRYRDKYIKQTQLNLLEKWRLWWSDFFGNLANKIDPGHY